MEYIVDNVPVGPWSGINNVQEPDAYVFQPPGELEKRRASLVVALNVDLDNDGWASARGAIDAVEVLDNGRGGWTIGDRVFVQDGATLIEKGIQDVVLLTTLAARVMLCEHWGKIYITDGVGFWVLDGQTISNWGLPVPIVSLSPAVGSLVSGRYLVQCAFIDAQGNEGGISDVVATQLVSATGITVDVANHTLDCHSVNVYISDRDQRQASYHSVVPIGALPYTIQTTSVTVADPPKTGLMTGPISGAGGVFSFRAFLLLWRDGVVFRSEAAEPHLFHGENLLQFGSTVRACESVAGGMWIGTESGLWWVAGEDPAGWIPVQKTFDAVARGSKKLQGRKLPKTGTDDLVALFVTASGLVVGMPDGTVLHLTDGVYTFDAATRVSFAYVERDNLRQIIINLVNDNES